MNGNKAKYLTITTALVASVIGGLSGFYLGGMLVMWSIIFTVIIICLILVLNRRRRIVKPVKVKGTGLDKDIFDQNYIILRNAFCENMIDHLTGIDNESNWSDGYYTHLEAEIEMSPDSKSAPRIEPDLIKAIRREDEVRSFLLVGRPGSGKSVSMRRLAKELYRDCMKGGERAVFPIYINLKEWKGSRMPNDAEISSFIYQHLMETVGRQGRHFLDIYYEDMLKNGLLFFLLDSFDEMPMVLDSDDQSDEIKTISKAFDTFFLDLHQCKGILSSRPFRQPIGFRGLRLDIRQFSEKQIREAMNNWFRGRAILDANETVRRILKEKPHLSSALRNPFMADLIAQYMIYHINKLPDNYYDLFEHYISNRFQNDKRDKIILDKHGLNEKEVIDAAIQIAEVIFKKTGIGLEISMSALKDVISDPLIEKKVEALYDAKLIRWGGGNKEHFSFVHRRFAEYFAVKALRLKPELMRIEAISEDSRWRDSLVVYCGIADDDEVIPLVEYAWGIVKENAELLKSGNVYQAKPAVHCLRFLRDACLSRSECLAPIETELSDFIVELIKNEDNLVAKIATEILALLTPEKRTEGLLIAFNQGIPWLSQTAFRACRHLSELDEDVVQNIKYHTMSVSSFEMLKNYKERNFTLSLSDALRPVRIANRLSVISLLVLWVGVIILFPFYKKLFGFDDLVLIFGFEIIIRIRNRVEVKGNNNRNRSDKDRKLRFIFRDGLDTSLRLTLLMSIFTALLLFFMSQNNSEEFQALSFSGQDIILYLILLSICIPINTWFSVYLWCKRVIIKPALLKEDLVKLMHVLISGIIVLGWVTLFFLVIFLLVFIIRKTIWLDDFNQYIPYALLIILGPFGIYILFRTFKKIVYFFSTNYQDNRLLKKVEEQDNISWNAVFQTLKQFNTGPGQTEYLRGLKRRKVSIIDIDIYPKEKITFKSRKAKVALAKLREQVYGLVDQ